MKEAGTDFLVPALIKDVPEVIRTPDLPLRSTTHHVVNFVRF